MTRRKVYVIVVVLALAVIAILVLQNTKHVDTHVLFATVTMPLAVLLLVTGVAGFVAGLLVGGFRKSR